MSNFVKIEIGELGTTITGKTPSSNFPEDFGNDYMFITPSDSFDNKLINQTFRCLSNEGLSKLKNKVLPPYSVLVSCIGSAMGKVTMNKTTSISNQQINSIIVDSKFDSHYIYYCLKNNYRLLRNAASGSTALPMLNKTDFDQLQIVIQQEKNIQQKIASVLSALDDKIEVNNKINAELEAMAKTLYDYWFVQFDFPNEKNKPYKSSGGKMIYNPILKREIPEGWEVKNVQEIANIVDCLHSKKPDYKYEDEKYFLAQLENILDNGQFDDTEKYYVSKSDYDVWTSRIEVSEDDILVTNAGRVGGNCQLPRDVVCGIGRNITAIRPINIAPTYFHQAFRGFDIQNQIKSNTDQGAFFQSLNVKGIKKLNFIIPQNAILNNFEKIVSEIRKKRDSIIKQNQELAKLRDWLLPMLMNGQVKVE